MAQRWLSEAERAANLRSFEQVWETVRDQYWDPDLGGLDWQAVHDEVRPAVERARTHGEFLDAVNGMIGRFGQSHFLVVPSSLHAAESEPNGAAGGDGRTGIEVRLVGGDVLATRIDADSPAAQTGVRPGWIVLRAGGQELAPVVEEAEAQFRDRPMGNLLLHRAIATRLAGPVGASKTIEFLDEKGERVTRALELARPRGSRAEFGHMPPQYVWFESRELEGGFGYIAFSSFLDPVRLMPAYQKAIEQFAGSRGLVLDLRGNIGGIALMAMGMGGFLVPAGAYDLGVMQTRTSDLKFALNPRMGAYTGRIAILIDGQSASCAEIFASGLRELGRASLFGTRTAGAVLPAYFTQLENGDFFYYPIADYVTQSGKRLEGVGVEPDVEAPYDRQALLGGKDPALEAALRWLRD